VLLIPPRQNAPNPRADRGRVQAAARGGPRQTRDTCIIELFLQTGVRLADWPASGSPTSSSRARRRRRTTAPSTSTAGPQGAAVTVNWKVLRAIKAYRRSARPRDERRTTSLDPSSAADGTAVRSRMWCKSISRRRGSPAPRPRPAAHLRHPARPQGTSLNVVRAALGTSSLKTTSIYVELAREQMDRSCSRTRCRIILTDRISVNSSFERAGCS